MRRGTDASHIFRQVPPKELIAASPPFALHTNTTINYDITMIVSPEQRVKATLWQKGDGKPDEDRARIFYFFRQKEPGTGQVQDCVYNAAVVPSA